MSLVVVCNQCGRKLRAKDEHAGRKIRCPECKAANRLPSRPQRAQAADSEICPVCSFDLSIDPDLVRDGKGRRFHRACFEEVRPQTKPKQSGSEVVQLYQAPQTEKPKPKPRPEEPVETPPPIETPLPADDGFLVAEPVEPSELPEARPLSEPLEALPEAKPFEAIPEAEPFAGVPEAHPLAGVADALPPADLPEAPVFDPSKPKSNGNPTWLYVLIGFGAAVPLILVLFMVIQKVTKPDKGASDVAVAEQPDGGAPESVESEEGEEGAGSSRFRSSWPDDDRSPGTTADREDASPEEGTSTQLAGMIGFLFLVGVFVVASVVGAVFLMLACAVCGEKPGYGKCLGVTIVNSLAQIVGGFVLGLVAPQILAVLLIPVSFLVFVAIISAVLPTDFGKACLITLLYIVIGLVAVAVIGVALALILPALQALRAMGAA